MIMFFIKPLLVLIGGVGLSIYIGFTEGLLLALVAVIITIITAIYVFYRTIRTKFSETIAMVKNPRENVNVQERVTGLLPWYAQWLSGPIINYIKKRFISK